ncbi:ribonuclease E/G [Leptolyngbya sp. FACHB-671]|uniref:Rne/Rng family ribonuclease n=1 Tax=Leptolyngbya sp. FACHB-671 TaxID=2692812 RepID=UPI0016878A31|nr:Rne/Rng family ribonuclease [Leptolyngbya sp. FACHB-671]MBD2068564.1 ribonuclease E/G [Leptolyngbya sp. FACHB-671]
MSKQIIIAEQHRIAAVFSEDQIQELIVATGSHQVGDIYLGVVENVLPGIDAAFVNIGDAERNGFIHVTDLGPLRLKRAAGSITELLAPQQKVLVQVMKEPTGNKGPRLTGNISLPGRYLVLMPFGRGVNLSRRIRNENERNRLRALAVLVKPAGMGLLVRTEAEGVAEEAIIEDLEALQKQWENIQQEAVTTRPPSLLNRDDDFIQRVLRDVYSADVNRIVVDSHTGMKRVKQHLVSWSGGRSPQGVLVDHHRDRTSILEYFRVNAAIREALKPRVDLPSGGYIIIERTEALTVIDVNSGSFTRSATARETVLWTNSEAAVEIARQLRLRNIAGVIIVDFIDMDSRRDQLQVLEQFNKAIRADKARPQIAQLSELGLVELTRKRQGQNIYELFGRTCPTCGGLGHLVHLPGESERQLQEFVEPAAREYAAPESRTPQLRENWDGQKDEFDADPSQDLQELDLTNHPSYQERGGANNRRRRRSRIRVGEPVARVGSPVRAEPDVEPELPPAVEETVLPTLIPKESRSEKPDRSRSSNRRDKPIAEPPQIVQVEMTLEEQDVYALMGVSPLVLATEEVKDPKSAVVTVTLPGESSRTGNGTPVPVVFPPSGFEQTAAEETSPSSTDFPLDDENGEDSVSIPVSVPAPDLAVSDGSVDSPDGNGSSRRRRRRSSAVESENTMNAVGDS